MTLSLRILIFPLICLLVTTYFIFHSIQGNRGLRRMMQINEEIVQAQKFADQIHAERQLWSTKVKSFSPNSFDKDQLEESALRVLNMGQTNDKIIFDK